MKLPHPPGQTSKSSRERASSSAHGHARAAPRSTDGDITLNFVNADLKDVAKAILGDYLKLNYEIAGNVTGTVTLQTSTPLTSAQVLPALEERAADERHGDGPFGRYLQSHSARRCRP